MQLMDNEEFVPPRANDPGWAHGVMINGGRQKIKCKYCHKVMLGGGISRLKQHLAGERGNVIPCEEVPEEVRAQIRQHLGFKILEKMRRQKGLKSCKKTSSYMHYREEEEDDYDNGSGLQIQKTSLTQGSGKRKGKEVVEGISSPTKRQKKQCFPTATTVVAEPLLQTLASEENMDQADMAVARFLCEAGIPFTAANSHYFQEMADAIVAAGPGYKMPSYHSLTGKLLHRNVQEVGEYGKELRKSWEVTGCSVMVDRWMDNTGHTVINIFVYCPKGTLFLKSVDTSDISNCPNALLDLFDGVVQAVGPKNIVNFITDSTPSYKAARELLADKYKTFFCSTCVAHCIELMLEEVGKMDGVKEVLAKLKKITQFIYNNAWVLNLIRKKAGRRDIVQLATTRFPSIFLTLKNIVSMKLQLHKIFTSATWIHSAFSKQRAGLEVADIIVDEHFWSLCEESAKVTNPLLSVLHLLDSEDKPFIGYIYNAMEKAKRSIIGEFNNQESKCMPYLKVIDDIWSREFLSPLYAAAYYLNPSIFYKPSFSSGKVIQKGFLDCIETLEPNVTAQVKITSHVNFYEEAAGDFGRPVALRGRESLAPATWWSLYAADCPDLQRFAVRILSQTCNIIRCDRIWSMFERICSKKRNQLEQEQLNDLLLVHYNLHLQQRRSETSKIRYSKGVQDLTCIEATDANMVDWFDAPGINDDEDLSWMDVTILSEKTLQINSTKSPDDSNDNANDRGSNDMIEYMNKNDDL